ncbi:MAG: hypothetical protein WBM43_03350, partial [Flavobacteriaceae bacterium]
SNILFNFRRYKTALAPMEIGLFAGFDVGRVWVDDILAADPSFNRNIWNTSAGGGFFLNASDLIALNLGLFNSDDNLRIFVAFKLGI